MRQCGLSWPPVGRWPRLRQASALVLACHPTREKHSSRAGPRLSCTGLAQRSSATSPTTRGRSLQTSLPRVPRRLLFAPCVARRVNAVGQQLAGLGLRLYDLDLSVSKGHRGVSASAEQWIPRNYPLKNPAGTGTLQTQKRPEPLISLG